jgi:SAM-dependent methyltransferase
VKASEFPWPALAGGVRPVWTGKHFGVGTTQLTVLPYTTGDSGWSDGLTKMHEESAGAHHPIDVMSREWALTALRRHLKTHDGIILEIGSSSGFLLELLRRRFPESTLIGSDFLLAPLERLADRLGDVPLLQFDAVRCPLPDGSVDAVILLNVLEHIEDDHEAMRQVARILSPGGVAVVEVPAGPHLYDIYDEQLQHYRRYSQRTLLQLGTNAGLSVVRRSHLGCLVYPGFALVKRRNRRMVSRPADVNRRTVEAAITKTAGSRLVRLVLRCESRVERHIRMPFGIRCVAIFRKM